METSKNRYRLQGSAVTNIGQVRSHNEDNVHLWTNEAKLLAIVADGMGGAAAGEEASRIAVETIQNHLLDLEEAPASFDAPEQELRAAIQAANLSIMQQAVDQPQQRGMGTTLTMVFVNGNEARFAHVGDSRAYRVNGLGEIHQVTSDHSFVQALLDAGHITEEQAENHPMGNVLYRALGQDRDVDVDTYSLRLRPGEKLVLCSDGLTRHVRPDEIALLAESSEMLAEFSQKLVDKANERGGEDNISVITISIERTDAAEGEAEEEFDDDDDTLILTDRRDSPPTQDASDVRASAEPYNHINVNVDATAADERLSPRLNPPRRGAYGPYSDPEGRDAHAPR